MKDIWEKWNPLLSFRRLASHLMHGDTVKCGIKRREQSNDLKVGLFRRSICDVQAQSLPLLHQINIFRMQVKMQPLKRA